MCFNPLQVSYKHDPEERLKARAEQFQSLIGQLQTDQMALEVLSAFCCFNPLQVSYKPEEKEEEKPKVAVFQSLIGQLQTSLSLLITSLPKEFQSLIGQLQTALAYLMFVHKGNCFNPLQVSYKLLAIGSKNSFNTIGFNPLQVSYKH